MESLPTKIKTIGELREYIKLLPDDIMILKKTNRQYILDVGLELALDQREIDGKVKHHLLVLD